MRLLLVVLVSALLMPTISAQEAPIRVIEDPTGDMYAQLNGVTGINDPTGHYDFQDIEWIDVQEDSLGFWFTVKVASIEVELDETIGFSDGGYMRIFFVHQDWDYFLEIERPSGKLVIEYGARLFSKSVESDDWGRIWVDDSTTFDLTANTITQFVAREDLPDSKGASPFPGRSLTEFYAITGQRSADFKGDIGNTGQSFEAPWHLGDAAPDDGPSDIIVPIMLGLQQSGNARLVSDEPFRASNGEETTFIYTVNATNVGDQPDLFILEAVGAPGSWDVTVPMPAIELDAGESIAVPILVHTPFAHIHGGTQEFVVTMTGTQDPSSIGRVEIGIRFLEIPQPAGHHDTVYFHSTLSPVTASFASGFGVLFAPNGQLYFNTEEQDEDDDNTPITGTGFTFGQETVYFWQIPLNPTLRMGLDFDLTGEGLFEAEFESALLLNDAVLEGELLLVGEDPNGNGGQREGFADDVTVLATFQTDPESISPGGNTLVSVPVQLTPESDYIPYNPANNLILTLRYTGVGPTIPNQNTAMAMLPGGLMTMPMFEYEDDITDIFQTLVGPHMEATEPVRSANPGDLIRFDVAMHDTGAASGDYGLSFTGDGGDYATIVEGDRIELLANGQSLLTVAVQVPDGALHGEQIDVFVQATNLNDSVKRGIVRLVVEVDTENEWEDDSATLGGEEVAESPAAILLLVGVLFWAARRKLV